MPTLKQTFTAALLATFLPLSSYAHVAETFAGCTPEAFVDAEGSVEVTFNGMSYSPKCVRVKKGSEVLIKASDFHPLQGVEATHDPINPIFNSNGEFTEDTVFSFQDVGVFGYFCEAHGDDTGRGMAGTIVVVE